MKRDREYTISEVSAMLGLEEGRIRFYETRFQEYFDFPRGIAWRAYRQHHIKTLSRIYEFDQNKKYSLNRIRRELSRINDSGERNVFSAHKPKIAKGRIIGVSSAKGGVGKTTFSVNLAMELAGFGYRVAIFDADLGLSNVHIFMGVNPEYNLGHVIKGSRSLTEVMVEGPRGIKIISGGTGIFELANLNAEQRNRLIRNLYRLEREVDFIVIDTGAGISENVVSFLSLADEVHVVTTRDIAAITDAYSLIKILVQNQQEVDVHLIVNRVMGFEDAEHVYSKIERCTEKFLNYRLKSYDYIMEDVSCFQATQSRVALAQGYPQSYALECIRRIAGHVKGRVLFEAGQENPSFFKRLFEMPIEVWKKTNDSVES